MTRFDFRRIFCGALLLLAACSKQEPGGEQSAEWDAIQPLESGSTPEVVVADKKRETADPAHAVPGNAPVPEEDFSEYQHRLEELKAAKRKTGETLLKGTSLVFDYQQQSIELKEKVWVEDDRGILTTDLLQADFSASNEVEHIQAVGHVTVRSEGREARAEQAAYAYATGEIRMEGMASVRDGGNQLSAERVQLWIKGNRRVVCEPNVLVEVNQVGRLGVDQADYQNVTTEVRAGKAVYDERERVIELYENVRLHEPRVTLNCERVRLHLKETREIDWIEALAGVIIQIEDRKAIANRVAYYADEQKIVLEGDPKVKQGRNVMTGDRMIFWQETRRLVCEPNARALLFVDDETKAKFLKDLDK